MKKIITYCLLPLYVVQMFAQSPKNSSASRKIDSLFAVLKTEKEDTNKVKTLNYIAFALQYRNPDSTILLAEQARLLAEKLRWKLGDGNALNNAGVGYIVKGDYPKALDFYLKALKIFEEIKYKEGESGEECNIATIYSGQNDFTNAIRYYQKALETFQQSKDTIGQIVVLGDMGSLLFPNNNDSSAIEYNRKALKFSEEIGDKEKAGKILCNIGSIFYMQNKYAVSEKYYYKAWQDSKQVGDMQLNAISEGNLGINCIQTGEFKKAEEYLKNAITLDSTMQNKNYLRQYDEFLSQLYDTTRRYKLALDWYKKAMVLKDTLFNIDKDKALTRKEMTFQFQHVQDSTKDIQKQIDAIQNEKVKRQNIILFSVSGGFILVLLLSLSIYRSLKQSRRKTEIIELKKSEVEKKNIVIAEKNKDILDSITYAKRLQDAILPPLSIIEKYLPESFVLYKPKDIIAGDFYWMESEGNVIFLAACDCTGHGVPGALVSVVCSNALNRAFKEFKIRKTGLILDKVRELVLETFSQRDPFGQKSEGEIKDGMDISFCAINIQTKEVEWSGAYNSLWYFENGEIKEMEADKQPIGKTDNPKSFTTHSLSLSHSTLYLFTDGFADQFGGPKGKKYKYRQFKEKLLSISQKPMAEQKEELEKEFATWKGDLEQTDDVCVIGIRI